VELRAKVGVQQDGLIRVKRENSELARDTITLHEENSQLRKERERGEVKLSDLIKGKASLEEEVRRLQNALDERCRKMEQEMPYINTVI
jgi:predicted  nucleic acid-binding Zn-ribbon protein